MSLTFSLSFNVTSVCFKGGSEYRSRNFRQKPADFQGAKILELKGADVGRVNGKKGICTPA